MQLPLLCEKSGAIPLVLVGLMAVCLAGIQATLVDLNFLKFSANTVKIFMAFKGTVLS